VRQIQMTAAAAGLTEAALEPLLDEQSGVDRL